MPALGVRQIERMEGAKPDRSDNLATCLVSTGGPRLARIVSGTEQLIRAAPMMQPAARIRGQKPRPLGIADVEPQQIGLGQRMRVPDLRGRDLGPIDDGTGLANRR